MKMKHMIVTVVGMSLFTAVTTFASVTDGVGTWAGSGSLFSIDGKPIANYSLGIVNTPVGPHGVQNVITIGLPDGTHKTITQTEQDTADGFTIESDLGKGGGYCVGEGICLAYVGTDADAFAITTIKDDASTKRMIMTELKNGKAVRVYRQKYVKIN